MWIVLQPPSGTRDHVYQILEQNTADPQASEACAVKVHLAFFALMASNWQEYLEYLQSELAPFVGMPALLDDTEDDQG